MTNLSGSDSKIEFGDWITRRPIPLTVHPFQILWNLKDRSIGASPGSSRILSNLTTTFPHESYIGKTRQVRLHSYYTQSFTQSLVTSPKSRSQVDPDAHLNPFLPSLIPGLIVPSHSNPLYKTSKPGYGNYK